MITAYIIIDALDPERKPITSRGGHKIWMARASAVNALRWKLKGGEYTKRANAGKQYEVIELQCQEKIG